MAKQQSRNTTARSKGSAKPAPVGKRPVTAGKTNPKTAAKSELKPKPAPLAASSKTIARPAKPTVQASAASKPPAKANSPVKSTKPAAAASSKAKTAAVKPAAPTAAANGSSKLNKKPTVTKSAPAKSAPAKLPPAEPVATAPILPANGKLKKNPAGLNARELEHYRTLLLEKRREIVGDMSSMEREALQSGGPSNLSTLPMHMADMGTDSYEQEFTLGLVEKERNLLREINSALAKIQSNTYGICEGTGLPIGKPRLEAQPWARYSIEHARRLERGGMGIRI